MQIEQTISGHERTRLPPSILIADDDELFRRALGRALAANGYRVSEASDGKEALEALASAADGLTSMPDLAILDACMPKLSGLGILAILRRFRNVPRIFLITGFPHRSVDVVATLRGASRIFHKPIDTDEVIAAIQSDVLVNPRPT